MHRRICHALHDVHLAARMPRAFLNVKRKNDWQKSASHLNVFSYALSTLLDLRQEAQTYNDL